MMESGRLSGKLYAHEDWLGLTPWARELLVTAWSWAIDHDKADGEIPYGVLRALSNALGHNDQDHPAEATRSIRDLVTWEWLDHDEQTGTWTLLRWEEQGRLIEKAIERREKERARYQRRKAGDA